jgi:hypothetical protein
MGPNTFRFEDHPNARRFAPVDPARIEALSGRLGVVFCDDYLAFLARFNGYDFDSLTAAAPWAEEHHLIDYVRYLFGIGTGFEYNDLETELGKSIVDPAYLRLLYPIGKGPGGNPIVQIHAGALRGEIMLIDDDVLMSPKQFEARYQKSLDSFPVDTLIPWLRDSLGAFVPVGGTLNAFLDGLLIGREDNGVINVAIVGK